MTEIESSHAIAKIETDSAESVNKMIRDLMSREMTQGDFLAESIKIIESALRTHVILPESVFDVTWDVLPVHQGATAIAVAVSGVALAENLNLHGKSHWKVFELFSVRDHLRYASDLVPRANRNTDRNIIRHVVTTGPVELVHRPDDPLQGNERRMAVMVTRYPVIVALDTQKQRDLLGSDRKRGTASKFGC